MNYLLAISVGPVQELIAAARRTRDLWFGSYLLSEISKAVAKCLRDEHGASLIFPCPDSDLQPGSELNVANVILVELTSGDPRQIAADAKQAARKRWGQFAGQVEREASPLIRPEIWADQADDVIEFYAAWASCTGGYAADRARTMRLLAGRKNCRDFLPAKGRAGVAKSSLDGQRESVLKPPAKRAGESLPGLRIRKGEQLDVVGVVKRAAEGARPYPSVARIAADPWVRGNSHRLSEVKAACVQLGREIIRPLNESTYPQFSAFPFEGMAVYTSRHHELLEETQVTGQELEALSEALALLPSPEPYLAVLVADGDRMGAALSKLPSADDHRKFSRALAAFACDARKIVDDHNGVLVYAGGDDVLAFAPTDKCLACARRLHDRFGESLADFGPMTLSVGIAIGHFMENLEDLLEYGRAAEKAAKKPDRDGLAVHLYKRGGSPIRVRGNWAESLDARLAELGEMLSQGAIPSRLPYELRDMARLYTGWPSATDEQKETLAEAIRQDVLRLLAKKQPVSGNVRERLAPFVAGLTTTSLRELAEELLVARQIAGALEQSGAHPQETMEAAR